MVGVGGPPSHHYAIEIKKTSIQDIKEIFYNNKAEENT